MLWSRSFSIADGQSASGLRCLSKIVSKIINDTFVFISWPCKMESFSNSKGPQSITKKLEDPKGITKGNIDVAAWTHKFSLATRYQRLNCFFGAAIDMSKVKSCTSETTPLATNSFKRSYKISHPAQILCKALRPHQKSDMILVNKVVLKLNLPKNHFNKKCAPKLLFFTKKKSERFRWFLT